MSLSLIHIFTIAVSKNLNFLLYIYRYYDLRHKKPKEFKQLNCDTEGLLSTAFFHLRGITLWNQILFALSDANHPLEADENNWYEESYDFGTLFSQLNTYQAVKKAFQRWWDCLLYTSNKVIIGVIVNTVIFALLHLGNPNIGPISFINLLLFGTFMSLYVLKTKNLWGACALHTMWNFTQGVVFGISVSGNDVASSIFHFTANKDLWFLNGGGFGAEGGLIVTVILGAALAGLVWWIQKDTKQAITE